MKHFKQDPLSKLNRKDLLELLVEQNRKIEALSAQLEEAERKLEDRRIIMEESGSMAEAALKLNGVFEAAQKACEQYLENIQENNRQESGEEADDDGAE